MTGGDTKAVPCKAPHLPIRYAVLTRGINETRRDMTGSGRYI
ncbi:hypothetical protein [Methanospirillum purgamenti]|nr:hypothetical protein [Methanospirillum hungatei]